MRVETFDAAGVSTGRRSVFDIMQSAMNAIETAADIKGKASGGNKTRLEFNLPSKMESWILPYLGTLTKVITADIAKDKLTPRHSDKRCNAETLVSAEKDADR